MSFESKVLAPPPGSEYSLPPSLPLIIERGYDWDWDKKQVVKCEEKTTGPEPLLKVLDGALEILHSIDKPIAVLSICGPYRTGKSYLLSRIVGKPHAFEVGHTVNACTKGVWMSTTVLECDKFCIVLLDTEGIDNPDDNDTTADFIKKTLTVTTLLSSLLIYNLQSVPQWSDLEDLSCFVQLSSSLNEAEYDDAPTNFPDFLWLIRDKKLELPTEGGRTLTPTEYLMKNVLCLSSNDVATTEDQVVSAILHLFQYSNIECRMLPEPTTDANILRSLVKNQHLLNKEFESELQCLIDYILNSIKVKKLCGSGVTWAELLIKFVDLVNNDDTLTISSTYLTAAEAALEKLSCKFVDEYSTEMEEYLQGKYPIEVFSDEDGETLLTIHQKIFESKRKKFEDQLDYHLSDDEPVKKEKKYTLLKKFVDTICVVSIDETTNEITIKSGALQRFEFENETKSREYCRAIANEEFRGIQQKMRAGSTSISDASINAAGERYFERSIGPAKNSIYEEVRKDLEKNSEVMKKTIPRRLMQLRATGMDKNRIQLRWREDPASKEYKVQLKFGCTSWTAVERHFMEPTCVIEDLQSNTEYEFQVRGVGETGRRGEWSDTCKCSTTVGAVTRGAATVGTFVAGLLITPVGATVMVPYLGPISTMGGIVCAPAVAAKWAKEVATKYGPKGELMESCSEQESSLTDSATSQSHMDD